MGLEKDAQEGGDDGPREEVSCALVGGRCGWRRWGC